MKVRHDRSDCGLHDHAGISRARHTLSLQCSFADCRVIPEAASASLRASAAAWISSSTLIGSRCLPRVQWTRVPSASLEDLARHQIQT